MSPTSFNGRLPLQEGVWFWDAPEPTKRKSWFLEGLRVLIKGAISASEALRVVPNCLPSSLSEQLRR